LPRWRGAAPIQRAILAGDKTTGIGIMQMNEGLDTGAILLEKTCAVAFKFLSSVCASSSLRLSGCRTGKLYSNACVLTGQGVNTLPRPLGRSGWQYYPKKCYKYRNMVV
jgi:hypothetical protein